MKCPECLSENDFSAKRCSTCGHKFVLQGETPVLYKHFYAEYFAFRELVTPHLIKVVYILGACVLTAAGILSIIVPDTLSGYADDAARARLGGVLLLLAGNLVWRMLCEVAILLFSLHEIVVSIDNRARALVMQLEVARQ